MILFDLKCNKNHKFECWFASSANYEEQLKNKMIVCPYCNSTKIEKLLWLQILIPKVSKKNIKDKKNRSSKIFRK